MSIEEKEISFNTLEEFYEWEEEFETTTRSLFVLKCAPQVSSNGMKVFYYYCNRASTCKSEGPGKHQLKTQGTAKIGSQCSAYINTNKILCAWHIYRTWRKAIVETVRDKDHIKYTINLAFYLTKEMKLNLELHCKLFSHTYKQSMLVFLPTLLQIIAHGYHNGQRVTVLKQQSTLTCTLNHFIES